VRLLPPPQVWRQRPLSSFLQMQTQEFGPATTSDGARTHTQDSKSGTRSPSLSGSESCSVSWAFPSRMCSGLWGQRCQGEQGGHPHAPLCGAQRSRPPLHRQGMQAGWEIATSALKRGHRALSSCWQLVGDPVSVSRELRAQPEAPNLSVVIRSVIV
jgi:hypothetical protein